MVKGTLTVEKLVNGVSVEKQTHEVELVTGGVNRWITVMFDPPITVVGEDEISIKGLLNVLSIPTDVPRD